MTVSTEGVKNSLYRSDIEIFDVTPEMGRIWRVRIGMITLASGLTAELEMNEILPKDALLLPTRIMNKDEISMGNLAEMQTDMTRGAATILPEEHLDVMIYCCTSGTIAMGEETVTACIRAVKPGIAVTNPFTATVAAFRALNLKHVAMLAPYTVEVTTAMREHLEGKGLEIVRTGTFGLALDSEICQVAQDAIYTHAVAMDCAEAEALFVSCTGLRVVGLIDAIEREIGKPVVTSNQALAWHALQLAGYRDPVPGFGALMAAER